MSAPVDVLAVLDMAALYVEETHEIHPGDFKPRVGERNIRNLREARAAVAELIEADKDYDDALADFAAGPFPNLTPDSIDEWADEWARVAQRADLQDRLESAKTRRAAALARVKGGAA